MADSFGVDVSAPALLAGVLPLVALGVGFGAFWAAGRAGERQSADAAAARAAAAHQEATRDHRCGDQSARRILGRAHERRREADPVRLHKFIDGTTSQAFELQEMGAAGTGSLEHGDASGEIFWMVYPFPVR